MLNSYSSFFFLFFVFFLLLLSSSCLVLSCLVLFLFDFFSFLFKIILASSLLASRCYSKFVFKYIYIYLYNQLYCIGYASMSESSERPNLFNVWSWSFSWLNKNTTTPFCTVPGGGWRFAVYLGATATPGSWAATDSFVPLQRPPEMPHTVQTRCYSKQVVNSSVG